MAMGPSANAAKSDSVASVKKTPLTATSQSDGQTMLIVAPSSKSQAPRTMNPATVTASTVGMGPTARLGKRARKSLTPQESAATSPSSAEFIGRCVP